MIMHSGDRSRSFTYPVFVAGLFVQALLCVLALLFYKERLVLPDDANYLFELLSNDGGFAVFHHRFIAIPAQFLPWLAVRAGAPLEWVARLYSLNQELFYAAVYICCGFALRNYRMALGLLLFQLLIRTDTFYWSVSELQLSVALLFALTALLQAPARRPVRRYLLIALLLTTVAFGHSLAMFAVGFLLALLWLRLPAARRQILISAGIYAAVMAVKMILFRDPYDRGAMGGLRNFQRLFPDYSGTASLQEFLERCLGDFIWLPLLFATLLVWCIVRRRRAEAALLALAAGGYLLLVTVCFPLPDPTRFYSENLYLPLAFFVALAAVMNLPTRPRGIRICVVAAALISIFAIGRILHARQRYMARLDWQRSLIETYLGQKVILPEADFPAEKYLLSWSSPYELWLLSSLESGRAASIVITKDPAEAAARAGKEKKAFLPAFGLYRYESLPQRYFPFSDTVSAYRIATGP